MGGIIDVGIRDPKTDALHGLVDVNLVDSSFLVEGPNRPELVVRGGGQAQLFRSVHR